jgi:3',5'-cyclic AMP phosphodiesterase CpdA
MQADSNIQDKDTTVLAHLSDPHLPLPGGISPAALFNKRLLGLLSWYTKRRKRYRRETLEGLVRDMKAQAPDWITVTGDLTNLGLESEFRQARRWLDQVAAPEQLMLVPGNHDASVRGAWESGAMYWEPFWRGDDAAQEISGTDVTEAFPVLRRRGQLALIGVSSAAASPAGFATGHVGETQRARLAELLRHTRALGLFRVLLIHHPLIEGTVSRRKRLLDGPELTELLAAEGVELVIHGHGHVSHRKELETRDGPAPVIGVPSASSMHGELAAYHLYRITRTSGGWELESTARRIRGDDLEFETAATASQSILRTHAGEQ